jgi:flagellin-specific chaperone FliS
MMDMMTSYRAGMFDGQQDMDWLRQGWRALRLYGRRARLAIEAGDTAGKTEMILKADQLLNVMSGILDTGTGRTLGPALMTIYTALRFTLLRANLENSLDALDDYDRALTFLDRDMKNSSESAIAK